MEVKCCNGLTVVGSLCNLACLYDAWQMTMGSQMGRFMWKASFIAVIWVILKDRNSQFFEKKTSTLKSLRDKVKFHVTLWFSALP